MARRNWDPCLTRICSACENLERVFDGCSDGYCNRGGSSSDSESSSDDDNTPIYAGSKSDNILAQYEPRYGSDCCDCRGGIGERQPRPGPVGGCCEVPSKECQDLKRQAQQKWTIRQTGGKLTDWWDRSTLIHEVKQKGNGVRFPRYVFIPV